MTDHLPECHAYQDELLMGFACICPSLRACEQRRDKENAYTSGYNNALDAAQEAVERASSLFQPLGAALAAIDALREKKP